MSVHEIEAKTVLRKQKRIDSWFISCYGMNLYRGCSHNCVYCDGRSEQYFVDGEFGSDISVKINAIPILRKELDPARKRKPLKRCYFLLGGGVGDSYQPLEKKYGLTTEALGLLHEFGYPVHALTKSTLVLKDLELFKKINEKSGAIVSFSFSSVDKNISRVLEPGVPDPEERLAALSAIKQEGIPCGMFLMPVVPSITDTDKELEKSICAAKEHGLDFVIFGSMTLKDGNQKIHFRKSLEPFYPGIGDVCEELYRGNKWGMAEPAYSDSLHTRFARIAASYRIPVRIPYTLFRGILEENDRMRVMLEHIDYMLKLKGEKSSFGYTSYLLSGISKPFSEAKDQIAALRINKTVRTVMDEIMRTGESSLYKELTSY